MHFELNAHSVILLSPTINLESFQLNVVVVVVDVCQVNCGTLITSSLDTKLYIFSFPVLQ